jgi:hypothetical protein
MKKYAIAVRSLTLTCRCFYDSLELSLILVLDKRFQGREDGSVITIVRFILQQLECRVVSLRAMNNDLLLTDVDGCMCA